MGEVVKNAMVAAPAADLTSYATLCTTDSAHTFLFSTILIVNTTGSNVLFNMGIDTVAGAPLITNGEFWAYNVSLQPNEVQPWTLGLTMTPTQYLRVSADTVGVTFFACYVENTV